MKEADRVRLHYGPYHSPRVAIGKSLRCRIRGMLPVCQYSDGRIPWPMAPNMENGRRGPRVYVFCGDLVRAVRRESLKAIVYWWGVGPAIVTKWRRALGVEAFNDGTRRLWSVWRPVKLPQGCRGRIMTFNAAKMRKRRLELGLSNRTVAYRIGWTSPNSYGQLEEGRRRRATIRTLSRIAVALECRVKDIC